MRDPEGESDRIELLSLCDRLDALERSIAAERSELMSKIIELQSRSSMRVAEAQRRAGLYFGPYVCAACGQPSRGAVCASRTGLGPWQKYCGSEACSDRIRKTHSA